MYYKKYSSTLTNKSFMSNFWCPYGDNTNATRISLMAEYKCNDMEANYPYLLHHWDQLYYLSQQLVTKYRKYVIYLNKFKNKINSECLYTALDASIRGGSWF